jgi:hypothetical protein
MFEWKDARWHWCDRPIHAGTPCEVRDPDGWTRAWIESADNGRVLIACVRVNGEQYSRTLYTEHDEIRFLG